MELSMRVVPRMTLAIIFGLSTSYHSHAAEQSGTQLPKDKSECLKLSDGLYAQAERAAKQTHSIVPREFARVASNLDDFCQQGNFEKAAVSAKWMETCIKNFRKPYSAGFCTRNKTYFCSTFPESAGCRGG
jgi:hypothetical protein